MKINAALINTVCFFSLVFLGSAIYGPKVLDSVPFLINFVDGQLENIFWNLLKIAVAFNVMFVIAKMSSGTRIEIRSPFDLGKKTGLNNQNWPS